LADSLKWKIKNDVISQSIKVGASVCDAARKHQKTSPSNVLPLWYQAANPGVSANPHIDTL
jgi:hypothetical protein